MDEIREWHGRKSSGGAYLFVGLVFVIYNSEKRTNNMF